MTDLDKDYQDFKNEIILWNENPENMQESYPKGLVQNLRESCVASGFFALKLLSELNEKGILTKDILKNKFNI
ncbi:MAG: hypothetical protein GY849_02225 [Deltaproteobacteria bacterium]|nr:hypothetical protein [Deltaproteobacteria bacterium]